MHDTTDVLFYTYDYDIQMSERDAPWLRDLMYNALMCMTVVCGHTTNRKIGTYLSVVL